MDFSRSDSSFSEPLQCYSGYFIPLTPQGFLLKLCWCCLWGKKHFSGPPGISGWPLGGRRKPLDLSLLMPLGGGQADIGLHCDPCYKRIRPPTCLGCEAGAGMWAQTVELDRTPNSVGLYSSDLLARENSLFRNCLLEVPSARPIQQPTL